MSPGYGFITVHFYFFYFLFFSITIYAKLQWIHNSHAGLIPVCTQLRNNKLQEKRCNVRLKRVSSRCCKGIIR